MVLSFQTLQHKGMIPWWLSCNLITFHQPPSRSKEDSSKTVIIPPACWYNLVGRFNSMQVSIKMWIPLYKNHGVLKKRSIWYFSIIFACPKPQDPNHLPGVKCHLSPAPQNKSWNGSPPNLRFWSFPVFSSFQGPSCLNSPTARAVPGCTFSNGTLKECKGPLWKPMKNLERKLYKLMGGQQSTPWHLLTWELQNAVTTGCPFYWYKKDQKKLSKKPWCHQSCQLPRHFLSQCYSVKAWYILTSMDVKAILEKNLKAELRKLHWDLKHSDLRSHGVFSRRRRRCLNFGVSQYLAGYSGYSKNLLKRKSLGAVLCLP